MDQTKREIFERAFTSGGSGCRRTCNCGREFYDYGNDGYSWEDGEIEGLIADSSATGLDYSVGTIIMDGQEFVLDCPCWIGRAEKAVAWMDLHARQIATYLTLEKARKQAAADYSPVVG